MKLNTILIISGVLVTMPLISLSIYKRRAIVTHIQNLNKFLKVISKSFLFLFGLVLFREILMLSHLFSNLKILNYPITFLYLLIYILIFVAFLIELWKVLRDTFKRNSIVQSLKNVIFIVFILTVTITCNILFGYGWQLTLINNEEEEKEFILNIENNKYLVPAKSSRTFYINSSNLICKSYPKKLCLDNNCLPLYHVSCSGFLGGFDSPKDLEFSSSKILNNEILLFRSHSKNETAHYVVYKNNISKVPDWDGDGNAPLEESKAKNLAIKKHKEKFENINTKYIHLKLESTSTNCNKDQKCPNMLWYK